MKMGLEPFVQTTPESNATYASLNLGGTPIPHIGYTGNLCRWRGYGFQATWSGKGYGFQATWSGKGYGFQAI